MAEMTRVALDAMGGDNAPVEMVKGAVDAVNKEQNVTVLLVGKEEIVQEELDKYSYDKDGEEVWTNETKYENEIILSVPYNDSQLFEVIVYAKDGDMVSNSVSYLYYLDNSDIYA